MKHYRLFVFGNLFLIILMASCKRETPPASPVINFKVGAQYTQNGAIIQVGHKLHFGIQARSDNSQLTNFTIKKKLENGSIVTVMDTAIYDSYIDLDKTFHQNVEDKVVWIFSVMDRNRMMADINMEVFKDPNSQFGGIFHYPSIKLGMQGNTQYGQFLDPMTATVYKTDSAYLFQNAIDVLCYFGQNDNPPLPVLSSPGEMDNFSTDAQTYYSTIIDWQVRNYTLWDISIDNGTNPPLTVSSFDAAHNDSLLIVSYNPVWGKKKFKYVEAGKIIPFQTASGKLGLVKVISNDTSANGMIEIEIKIQQ